MKQFAFLAAIALAVALTVISCGSGEDRAQIATEVANEWVGDNIDNVSEAIAEALTLAPALGDFLDAVPAAKTLVADAVADQIRAKIDWTFSTPSPQDDIIYRVTATAGLDIEIDPPVLAARTYTVSLPVRLLIDTDARTVQEWSADFGAAAVRDTTGQ